MGDRMRDRSEFESGKDPTGVPAHQRLIVRLSHDPGTDESIDGLLELPGVVAAARSEGAILLVDIAPEVLSSDEIRAAVELTGASVSEIQAAEREDEPPKETSTRTIT